MTVVSWPWDGTSTGDANQAPYTSSEYAQFVRVQLDDHGVSPNPRLHIPVSAFNYGSLQVTGTASPVTIATGYCFIAGYTFMCTVAETLAIPTPGANPRRDRVVLRIDWAAQSITIARLAGVEAANPTPPVLTQTIGTTYEVSLAQVHITTGGVITVLDERVGLMGLGPGVFFRDIRDRVFEEAFDNFGSNVPVAAGAAGAYFTTLTSGTLAAATGESAVQMNTTATGSRDARISYGVNSAGSAIRQFELSKAPVLFEARMSFAAAFDANVQIYMCMTTGAADQLKFGMIGSVSTTNLVIQGNNGGPTNFTTPQAGDASGAYHTYGIYLPASGGPAIAIYDGIPIGHVSANLPASTTDLTASFFVSNGATAADRVLKVDWWRWVRGTN